MRVTRNDVKPLLRRLDNFVDVVIPEVSKKITTIGVDHASSIAPIRSGALIQGITSTIEQRKRGKGGRFINTGTIISRQPENIANNNPRNVPYQAYLEFGRKVNVRNGRVQRYMAATAEWLDNQAKGIGEDAAKKLR